MNEPLKVSPDLWHAVLCALPPTEYRGVLFLNAVANEIITSELPHSKDLWLAIGWQRGIGPFEFRWRIANEDANVLLEVEPETVVMELRGNTLIIPFNITVYHFGLYLLEGFLDDEPAFRTTFSVVPLDTVAQN